MAAPPSGDSAAGRRADVGLRPLVGSAYGCAVLHLGLYAGDLRSTGGRETVRRGAWAAGTASRSADRAPRRSVGHRRQCARTGRLAAIRRTGRQRFPALAGRARCCNSVRIQVRAARSPFPSTDRVGGGGEPTLRPAAGGGRAHRRGRTAAARGERLRMARRRYGPAALFAAFGVGFRYGRIPRPAETDRLGRSHGAAGRTTVAGQPIPTTPFRVSPSIRST